MSLQSANKMRVNFLSDLILQITKGDGTRARALRSSVLVAVGFGGSNVLRLASNLILTRLLFPEAFGLMALVQVFMVGLQMVSDLGINLSIIQHDRGEEPDFLNTAWTIQIVRGVLLWLGSCAIAYPVAHVYGEPQLASLIPVVGLNAILLGFTTTRIALVNRNLQIGVQTMTDLMSQVVSLLAIVILAYLTRSVWALVFGGLFGGAVKVASQHILLKGPANRLHFDREISREILLGTYVSLTDFGIFSIAFILAMVPLQLAQAAGGQIIFPIYRKFLTTADPENRAKVSKARRSVLVSTVLLSGALSIASIPLVNLLYDTRYHKAGPILALLGFSITAQITTSNYDGAYLSHGDSRRHFFLVSTQAVLQVVLSIWMISWFGLIGAIFALGATVVAAYPFKAYVAHRYNAWDPATDALTFAIGLCCVFTACVIWREQLLVLLRSG
jgi:O-antigen/teichoic acid export membrane protein